MPNEFGRRRSKHAQPAEPSGRLEWQRRHAVAPVFSGTVFIANAGNGLYAFHAFGFVGPFRSIGPVRPLCAVDRRLA